MKQLSAIIFLIFALLILITVFVRCGYAVNLTASEPRGLWQKIENPFKRDAFVLVCIPSIPLWMDHLAEGTCASGHVPLLKQIMGMRGDRIILKKNQLQINEKSIAFVPQKYYPVQSHEFILKPDEYWLWSNHPKSFDSRYFGVVKQREILTVVKPVWVL